MKALEHVLHRMFAADVAPLKLRVEMAGYREARDLALRSLASALAAEARRTGTPQETPALNAYERRIVHMAAAVAGGVVSKSEGEGAERRVVLHPAPEAPSGWRGPLAPPAPRRRGAAHRAALRALGVPQAAEAGLLAYLGLLAAWSPRVNLTGARTPEERVKTLVAPVLPLLALVPEGSVLDLGSGNGSPGLVLALLRPDLR